MGTIVRARADKEAVERSVIGIVARPRVGSSFRTTRGIEDIGKLRACQVENVLAAVGQIEGNNVAVAVVGDI